MDKEKKRLTIPEIQKRLKEMGRKARAKKEKEWPVMRPINVPPDLPIPYYNLMD